MAGSAPADPSPASPMSTGPFGLLHPGYRAGGLLTRPYAAQLCWAAAVWAVTGQHPYPCVLQPGPPLLQSEGSGPPAYAEAVSELQQLLPLLLLVPPATVASTSGSGPATPAPEAGAQHAGQGVGGAGGEAHVGQAGGGGGGPADVAAHWLVDAPSLERLLLSGPMCMVLLGLRLTAGSARELLHIPSLRQCRRAFERRHTLAGSSLLTVGACATEFCGHWVLCGNKQKGDP